MKRLRFNLLILFLIAFLIPTSTFAEETKRVIVKGEIPTSKNSENVKSQSEISSLNHGTNNSYEIYEVPEEEIDAFVENLLNDPSVAYVEVEQPLYLLKVPNDPFFQSQRKDFDRLRVLEGWNTYNPLKRVRVAVIDSGIKLDHPDLSKSLIPGRNFISQGPPVDKDGHGTHVAGIIGAQTNNNTGVASISKGMVEIMPLKVIEQEKGSTIHLANAIVHAVDNGAEIINMSLGFYNHSPSVYEAVQYAYDNDVLLIAAAGNNGEERVMYPAAYKEVIAVAAIDSNTTEKASFSNYGTEIELTAPGQDVFSTFHQNNKLYEFSSGTSMAAPFATSLAALLKSHQPSLTDLQIRQIINDGAVPLDSYTGLLGNGHLDVKNSLDLVEAKHRIYGKNAIHTSVEIANKGWKNGINTATLNNKAGKFAVLSTNQSFPDSLTGTTLAYQLDAPLLLTHPTRLDEQLLISLQELGVTDIILLGGEIAISRTVENQLSNQGYTIHRMAGENRYETNHKINHSLERKSNDVIIASGENFPDALAVAPFASKRGIPIVLVRQNGIPSAALEYLNSIHYTRAIVLGGEQAISNSVLRQLKNPIRIAGNDRYDTAVKINEHFNRNASSLLFASGENFRDALAGANFAAKRDMNMVLVRSNRIPGSSENYLKRKVGNQNTLIPFHILGGPVAINHTVAWDIDRMVNYRGYYDGNRNIKKINLH
ncbi:MAG: S8 family serine peptidase [Bacillaceae bacterium]|nr:S8 family serine peptidase [Bacillaceae bacterium]